MLYLNDIMEVKQINKEECNRLSLMACGCWLEDNIYPQEPVLLHYGS